MKASACFLQTCLLLLYLDIYVGSISGHHDTIALHWHICGQYQWSWWHYCSALTYMWAVSVVMMTLLLCIDIYVGCISGHHDTIALHWHICGLYQWSWWHYCSALTYMWAVSVVIMTLLLCVDIYVGCISGHHDTIALRWHICGQYQWSWWHYCSVLTYMWAVSVVMMTLLLCVDIYVGSISGHDDTIALRWHICGQY